MAHTKQTASHDHEITISRIGERESAELDRISQLEGRRLPAGELLGAFAGDTLIALIPLQGGAALADPFRPTQGAVALLHVRAKQLRGGWRRRRARRLRWSPLPSARA